MRPRRVSGLYKPVADCFGALNARRNTAYDPLLGFGAERRKMMGSATRLEILV